MQELVYLLSVWCVMAYAVGVATGWIARHACEHALRRQLVLYGAQADSRPPMGAIRGLGILVWGSVITIVVAFAVAAEYAGIRPPGTADFTFAMFLIGVLPACVAGAALGVSIAISHRNTSGIDWWNPSWKVSMSLSGVILLLVILAI